jgi:hypothetical protein
MTHKLASQTNNWLFPLQLNYQHYLLLAYMLPIMVRKTGKPQPKCTILKKLAIGRKKLVCTSHNDPIKLSNTTLLCVTEAAHRNLTCQVNKV